MNNAFANTVLSFTPAMPGFRVGVHHCETPPGGREKVVEKSTFPVIGWVVVRDETLGGTRVEHRVEPAFLVNGRVEHTSDYRWTYSDLEPDPGEPKRTVGITVIPPEEYV